MEETYTIEQILYYLDGNIIVNAAGEDREEKNFSLRLAIHEISDKEDGIAAVLQRQKEYDNNESFN